MVMTEYFFFLITIGFRTTMTSPGMDHRVALMGVIIVRYQNHVRCINVVSVGEESQSTATLLSIEHSVQIRVYRDIQFGVTSVEGKSRSPHGIGHLGSDQIAAFLRSPISNCRSEGKTFFIFFVVPVFVLILSLVMLHFFGQVG